MGHLGLVESHRMPGRFGIHRPASRYQTPAALHASGCGPFRSRLSMGIEVRSLVFGKAGLRIVDRGCPFGLEADVAKHPLVHLVDDPVCP